MAVLDTGKVRIANASFETLRLEEPAPGVALISLTRPPVNAVNLTMLEEFRTLAEMLAADDDTRVAIITGEGKTFSVGADMAHFQSEFAQRAELAPIYIRLATKVGLLALETLPKPVICALNGTAVGEGLEIAMASDFRIAARSARLGFPEANIGLIPASGGCSRIVKLVGLARAKEMVLLGELMDAEEAATAGLLWRVVEDGDLIDAAVDLASRLARKAPLALGMAKAVLRACADVDVTSGHTLEMMAQSVLMKTRDHEEGVEAFLSKRAAEFIGR
jgi:enoyl-CoA hydratase/carnithine racemase